MKDFTKNDIRKGENVKPENTEIKEGERLILEGCKNLNIRRKPLLKDAPVTIVDKYDLIEFTSSAGKDWFKVRVEKEYEPGVEYIGYAMSKFLTRAE